MDGCGVGWFLASSGSSNFPVFSYTLPPLARPLELEQKLLCSPVGYCEAEMKKCWEGREGNLKIDRQTDMPPGQGQSRDAAFAVQSCSKASIFQV
jgi:hypothetical protein